MRERKISELLSRYSNKLPIPESRVINIFIDSVIEILGKVVLKPNEISFKNGVVYLKSHPAIKTEIFLQKDKIIKTTNDFLGKKVVLNIK